VINPFVLFVSFVVTKRSPHVHSERLSDNHSEAAPSMPEWGEGMEFWLCIFPLNRIMNYSEWISKLPLSVSAGVGVSSRQRIGTGSSRVEFSEWRNATVEEFR
jgi:hypothetical protein